jgi:hypothetical protein
MFRRLGRLRGTGRLLGLFRASNRFRWCAAIKALNRFPDPGDRRLAICELLHRRQARNAIPDFHEPVSWPVRGKIRQFLLAGEALALRAVGLGFLLARESRDVVFRCRS